MSSTVWIVKKTCGCPVMRTADKLEATTLARRRGYILDAIPCATEARAKTMLAGEIVLSCNCAEQAV